MKRLFDSRTGIRTIVVVMVIVVGVVLLFEGWPSPENPLQNDLAKPQQLPGVGPDLALGEIGDCLRLDRRTSFFRWESIGWASGTEARQGFWWDADPFRDPAHPNESFCILLLHLELTVQLPELDPGEYRVCSLSGGGNCTKIEIEGG